MKIIQLVTKRQYRGAEVFAANLSKELIEFGHEILFVGLYTNKDNILEVPKAKNLDLSDKKKNDFSINLLINLIKLLRKEKPDVIQCNGSDTLKYMVAASYFVKHTPIIYRNISVISEWIDGGIKKWIYKLIFKRVDHVSSVGTESIKDLIKTFNYPENHTSVIRRGIPLKKVEDLGRLKLSGELGLNEDDRIVIHIGNFSAEKNHSFLIDVFSKLKFTHPHIKLVCVGTGDTYKNIKTQIEEKGLTETIFLLGFRKDIPELLADSDFFVLSSLVEGVPGVILEAGAQKKPSIATNVGGVEEVLMDRQTGFIIDDFDKKRFRKRIIELAEDEDLRSRMGENAYKLVSDNFNPVKNAQKFEKLYRNLITGEGHKRIDQSDGYKILQLIQKKQFRGAEVFSAQLSQHFQNMGHDVEIFSIYDGQAQLPFSREIKTLKRHKKRRFFDFSGWKELAYIIRELKPNIVQANAADTLKYAVLSKVIFGWSAPIVYRNASSSSFYINNSFSRKINSFLLKNVDLIISVSQASKADLNKVFPFTGEKSIVIPVGVEKITDHLKSQSVFSATTKNIIHVGSFTREKNHIGLLRIFKEVCTQNSNVSLHLLGSGPLKEIVENQVKEFKLEGKVHFYEETNNPIPFLKSADVLVLPSIIEGLPGVILEAMAHKVPVVAYDVGGISEVLNEKTGTIINKGAESDFCKALLKVLDNRDETQIENAQLLVHSKFCNQKIANSFIKAYELVDN